MRTPELFVPQRSGWSHTSSGTGFDLMGLLCSLLTSGCNTSQFHTFFESSRVHICTEQFYLLHTPNDISCLLINQWPASHWTQNRQQRTWYWLKSDNHERCGRCVGRRIKSSFPITTGYLFILLYSPRLADLKGLLILCPFGLFHSTVRACTCTLSATVL